MNDILASLNPQQLKAATHTDGPLVVFAGAGSGKTRIITTRIAYLISKGVYPWEILAVTFTNKAAKEMKERVEAICPDATKSLITTFHSACARWLREFAYELGYDKNFTIYDDSDSTNLLKGIIKKLHPKADQTKLKNEMKSFLHFVKTNGYFPSDLERLSQEYPGIIPTGGAEIYKKYQESLAMNNSMDFGDLIMNVLLLLRKNEAVQKTLGRKYKYILVDEFQDTNRLQFELINLLSKSYGNLFVVGDDDQSIYSWRGAVPANIIDFDKVYSDAKVIALELNYRCTNNIVTAAREVIKNNRYRADKSLQTEASDGDLIDLQVEPDGDSEAWAIADSINAEIEDYSLDQIHKREYLKML